ncbi:MAG: alkaline phosphatase family protein [bacterium]
MLEGAAAGAVLGAWLHFLELSATWHVWADALNAVFRVLSGRFADATLIRLDTAAVATAWYVGGHALIGAGVALVIGALVRRGPSAVRAVLVGAALVALDGFVLGSVWRHRALAQDVGWALVGIGGVAAAIAGVVAGAITTRLPRGPRRALASGFVVSATIWVVGVSAFASRAPARPDGTQVADPERVPTGVKIAILGLDGIDGRLVDEAIAAGRMPNLQALIERGCRGDLRSIRPPKSPVVWTSVATGAVPSVHGIEDFVVRRDGDRVPVTSNLRRVPAIWNLGARAGFTSAFVNWYVTWPAEAIAGAMISDRVDFDDLPRRISPEALTAAVDSARARVDARADREIASFTDIPPDRFADWRANRWGQARRSLGILDDVVRHDLVTLESARVALRHGQPDLTALYFRGNDNTQHLFWKYRLAAKDGERVADLVYGDLTPEEEAAFAPVVDRYYRFMDGLLGEALDLLDPETGVLVLSDHGFLTNNERSQWWRPNRLLELCGLAELQAGTGGAADSARSVVFDPRPPTVDARRVLRIGGLGDATSLALAKERLAACRVNGNEPLFRALALDEDELGPRLVAVFDETVAGDRVLLPPAGATGTGDVEFPLTDIRVPEGHSGDHRMDGLLVAAGGPFRAAATIDGARAIDIASTVLYALGAPCPLDVEGVPLMDLFDPAWREAHPVRWIATYGAREDEEPGDAIATGVDDRIRDELRALGYIE